MLNISVLFPRPEATRFDFVRGGHRLNFML